MVGVAVTVGLEIVDVAVKTILGKVGEFSTIGVNVGAGVVELQDVTKRRVTITKPF